MCFKDILEMFMKTLQMKFIKDLTSKYGNVRQLPKGKNKNVSGLMKGELSRKVMAEFSGIRPKTYS